MSLFHGSFYLYKCHVSYVSPHFGITSVGPVADATYVMGVDSIKDSDL